MDNQAPFVITIVGAESSGKTTLARQLAAYYECTLVEEFAREYLSALDRPYHMGDLDIMARQQWEIIRQHLPAGSPQSAVGSRQMASISAPVLKDEDFNFGIETGQRPILVIDSGMLTFRIWARIKFGMRIPLVEEVLQTDITSLYLLCRPLPQWEPDALREAPLLLDRVWIYNQYLAELLVHKKPVQLVTSLKDVIQSSVD